MRDVSSRFRRSPFNGVCNRSALRSTFERFLLSIMYEESFAFSSIKLPSDITADMEDAHPLKNPKYKRSKLHVQKCYGIMIWAKVSKC